MMCSKIGSAARTLRVVALAAASLWLAGCATSGNPKDPAEGFNRAMYSFNDGLDSVLIKPVATGYDSVLPSPVKTGVSNFFGNLGDLWIGINNLLQGKPTDAVGDGARFVFNSTFGILGLIDIATPAEEPNQIIEPPKPTA